jgi:DNA-binding SARP family transcriptional activator
LTGRTTALVYGVSVIVLAGIIVTTAAFTIGVRTAYGNGISPGLGSQIARDFLGDQEAEAKGLTNSDPSALSRRLTGNALVDVSQQISDQSAAGPTSKVSFQPSSLTILRSPDPIDASLVIEVREDGTRSVTTAASANSAPSQQTISFHGDFWLRQDSSGRYLIADQNIQNQPASNLPALALLAVALAWVALAAGLMRRLRSQAPAPATRPAAPLITVPPAFEAISAPVGPPAKVVIRTFGGLQLQQDGEEWAAAFKARPVTAFIWLRLLIAAIGDPNSRPSRDELGRQASPGYDRETQLKKMRNIVYKLRELPPALRDRIRVEPQVMSFTLEGCEVDAINLLRVAAEGAGRSVLAPAQMARARRAVEASAGVFLPEFESIEDIATDRHPTCTELIRELRESLATKRLDLILLLGDSYTAADRPAEAIAILEPVFQQQTERDDLRARLVAAYNRAGRGAEASALEDKPGPNSTVELAAAPPT